ncbi:MAG: zonular occludens toxin domain-containing protein, partial [Candidatus Micrarchaeota archaeon]|nr:zonular occludens toxin domain-containing protein [Candidatus Micrarchaeota archaeon]
ISKSAVGIILGARGSGKSVLGMRLLENAKAKGRKVQALGFASSSLPSWIECIDSIEKAKNNSFLLVDEGGITFSSRSSMGDANKLLSQLLFISRHKDLSVLFISQNSANIDVNAIRQADYLLLKKSSLLQLDFERKKIKEIYEQSSAGFAKYSAIDGVTFVYSDEFRGFIANGLPSFWSEGISKSFSGFQPKSKE